MYIAYLEIFSSLASNTLATLGAILAGSIVYFLVLILLGGMNERDIERIPMVGKFIIKLLQRVGAFKA